MKGGELMNSNLLKSKFQEFGMTQSDVAKAIGMSPSRLNAKINSYAGAQFSLGEVQSLKRLLQLESGQVDKIFFT